MATYRLYAGISSGPTLGNEYGKPYPCWQNHIDGGDGRLTCGQEVTSLSPGQGAAV